MKIHMRRGEMKVEISDDIVKRLKKRIEEKGDFKSIDEYVNYILQQVVERLDSEKEGSFSKEEEEKVKERLRNFGYLS